jgi:hypothetical protein
MNEQEIRAWSLEIAAIMLGVIPETDSLDSRIAYEPYINLAKRLERYIASGVPPQTRY